VRFDDQVIGMGDGVRQEFQLTKSYRSGAQSYERPISKPVVGSVRVGVEQDALQEGVDYTLDASTGLIRFTHPPESGLAVRAGFEFDVPVRFDTDRIQTSVASFQAGDVPNVPVVELRV
jgi:uncharacterized protein (TIGR02217 family)